MTSLDIATVDKIRELMTSVDFSRFSHATDEWFKLLSYSCGHQLPHDGHKGSIRGYKGVFSSGIDT